MLGAAAVLAWSMSLPATRAAVVGGLDPFFVGLGRAAVAGVLAAAWLAAIRAPRPDRRQWRSVAVCAAGVVVGFPLLTSLALVSGTAVHAVVVIGILPAATAVFAVVRAAERPSGAFWLAAGAGLAIVLAFAALRGGSGIGGGDLMLLAGVVLCGLGYAEGGALARELGGPATICWALLLSLPLSLGVTAAILALDGVPQASSGAWAGFAYVALVSMLLGFFAWYAGLASGGVARIAQVQLLQPLLSLGWAALLLSESVGRAEAVAALAIIACVAATQRARVDGPADADLQSSRAHAAPRADSAQGRRGSPAQRSAGRVQDAQRGP